LPDKVRSPFGIPKKPEIDNKKPGPSKKKLMGQLKDWPKHLSFWEQVALVCTIAAFVLGFVFFFFSGQ